MAAAPNLYHRGLKKKGEFLMESNKSGMKIRDWAVNLGFRLPDGSTPSVDYFALLTATPHRRHLWETITDSVQQRQKVEYMRKQILVFGLQVKKKLSKRSYSKQLTDKIDLWNKQNTLETEIKENRNAVIKLERNTLAKASDLVFEICKLAEVEKQFEELNDKLLILNLLSKRGKKLVEELESKMLEMKRVSCPKEGSENHKENSDLFINQLLNTEQCKSSSIDCHSCSLLNILEELYKSGISEKCLWEEVINYKKKLLQQYSQFLLQLNSTEKNILSEKAAEIRKNVNHLVTQLKQKMTLKSLEVMINSTKGKFLESEIKRLEERVIEKEPNEENLNEAVSFLSPFKMNECRGEHEESYKNLRSYLTLMGLKTYREFLKEELRRLEDDEKLMLTKRKNSSKEKEESQKLVIPLKAIIEEINSFKSDGLEIGKKALHHYKKLEILLLFLKNETEEMIKTKAVEETAEKLKAASEKQIELYMEISSDSFRTLETSSGRIIFECESESHCLENYGGELKQFFTTLLIPPLTDLSKIISEFRNRKQIISEIKKFISDRNKLMTFEKKIQNQVNSVKCDLRFCEKNFKDADGILWSTFSKTDNLVREIDFIEKILRNWLEQPYRLMIREPIQGMSFKEFEKQYRKDKNK